MKSEYYQFTVRNGSEITKEFIVQAQNQANAEEIVEQAVLTNGESIMTVDDVTQLMGEKETLQEFVNKIHDADRLIVTGGKYINTIESE